MKKLKRDQKKVRAQDKVKTARAVFMSMNLPANIVKGVNRKMRKVS